jgi:hypothetical protein
LAPNPDDSLERQLRDNQARILGAWREAIFASFPPQSARLLTREQDPFRNPVGHRIGTGTESLLEGFVSGRTPSELAATLDSLVRVAAVQDQPASQAVGFIFLLKRVLRAVVGEALSPAQLALLDERIDGLALAAFDIYATCREQVCEIRIRAANRRVAALIARFTGDVGDTE